MVPVSTKWQISRMPRYNSTNVISKFFVCNLQTKNCKLQVYFSKYTQLYASSKFISPLDRIFSTCTACNACGKYEVCTGVMHNIMRPQFVTNFQLIWRDEGDKWVPLKMNKSQVNIRNFFHWLARAPVQILSYSLPITSWITFLLILFNILANETFFDQTHWNHRFITNWLFSSSSIVPFFTSFIAWESKYCYPLIFEHCWCYIQWIWT